MRASQVAWGNRLLRLLGAPVPGERLLDALADHLEKIVGEPYEVFFYSARTFAGSTFDTQADGLWSTTFALEPDLDLGLLGIDRNLVQGGLEALLEDEPVEVRTLLPVTSRDFGLMTFILLELLNWLCARGLPPLSVPANVSDPRIIARQFSKQAEIVELVYSVSSSTSAGLVHVFLPSPLIQSMEVFVTRGTHLNRQRRRLISSRLAPLRTRLGVEGARVHLGLHDYLSLGEGDILMPETHGFKWGEECGDNPDKGGPAHDAKVYLNELCGAYFPCRIHPILDSPWQVEFGAHLPRAAAKSASIKPPPSTTPTDPSKEISMTSEEIQKQCEEAVQIAPVLEQAQVEVQISVGEVALSMSELAQLQSGYVLELERSVKDGVELIVDGVQVGLGELVLVEQRLGVRVLSIEA